MHGCCSRADLQKSGSSDHAHTTQEATGGALCQLWGLVNLLDALEAACTNLVCQLGALCSKETRKATILQGKFSHGIKAALTHKAPKVLSLSCPLCRSDAWNCACPIFSFARRRWTLKLAAVTSEHCSVLYSHWTSPKQVTTGLAHGVE